MKKPPKSISFDSPVEAIRKLGIYELPEVEVLNVKSIAHQGTATVYQDDKGKLYSSDFLFSAHYVLGRGWTDNILKCIQKLGLITTKQLTEHFEAANDREDAQENRNLVYTFRRTAARLDILLTKQQEAKLKKLTQ